MSKTIEVTDLQKDIEQVVDEVATTKEPYVLTRKDKPSVVMISYEDYMKMLSKEETWVRFEKTWHLLGEKNAQYSEDEISADVEAAVKEVRAARKEQ